MKKIYEVPIVKPTSWCPPFGYLESEDDSINLKFGLIYDFENHTKYRYSCRGCLEGGGPIDSIFCTESAEENKWNGEDGIPPKLVSQMREHALSHEVIWRWATQQNLTASPE